ncbi:hypothetical protein [Metarhizobium album]|uniref:hypothetical protein n=1 Tax=Metarhizobium album TaxID=2182425 RepID=UPI000FFEB469|nr:hypothetical protein [Rhizobium album]
MAAPIDPDQARQLESRIGGWIAGLQMAALWLQRGDNATHSADFAELDGRHHFFTGYLAAEVLDSQPPEIRGLPDRHLGAGTAICPLVRRAVRSDRQRGAAGSGPAGVIFSSTGSTRAETGSAIMISSANSCCAGWRPPSGSF